MEWIDQYNLQNPINILSRVERGHVWFIFHDDESELSHRLTCPLINLVREPSYATDWRNPSVILNIAGRLWSVQPTWHRYSRTQATIIWDDLIKKGFKNLGDRDVHEQKEEFEVTEEIIPF